MKTKGCKKVSVTTMIALGGVMAVSVSVLAVKKVIRLKKKEKINEENILNLIKMTKDFKNDMSNDKVKEYIKFIDKIQINNSTLGVAKDGYELIKDNKNVDKQLRNDLGLLLEMKGVRSCFKFEE